MYDLILWNKTPFLFCATRIVVLTDVLALL